MPEEKRKPGRSAAARQENEFAKKGSVAPKKKTVPVPDPEEVTEPVKEEAPAVKPAKESVPKTASPKKTEKKPAASGIDISKADALLLGGMASAKERGISRTFYLDADINEVIKKYGGKNQSKYVNLALRTVFESLGLL